VISCDSIQINLSNVFYQFSRIKFLTKNLRNIIHTSLWILKILRICVRKWTDRQTATYSRPSEVLELDYRHLKSKYPTISRYRDTERHDISISLLGYDMNPISDWCRSVRTVRHQCRSVFRTFRHWCRTVSTSVTHFSYSIC